MSGVLFSQILIMFVLLGAGYVLYKYNLITTSGSKDFSALLVYLAMPATILNAYNLEFTNERLMKLGLSFLLALLCLLVALVIAKLFFHREDGIIEFAAMFSNAGFIGIPLVRAALNEEAVFYVSSFVVALMVLQFTYGAFLITKSRRVVSVKNIFKSPIVLSSILALALFVARFQYPSFLASSINALSQLNTPLAMINLGIFLGEVQLQDLFKGKIVYKAILVRLVIIPLASLALLSLFPSSMNDIKMTMLIVAAAPAAANVAIIAQTYQKDFQVSLKIISLSTLFSMASMPILVAIAQSLWHV